MNLRLFIGMLRFRKSLPHPSDMTPLEKRAEIEELNKRLEKLAPKQSPHPDINKQNRYVRRNKTVH